MFIPPKKHLFAINLSRVGRLRRRYKLVGLLKQELPAMNGGAHMPSTSAKHVCIRDEDM